MARRVGIKEAAEILGVSKHFLYTEARAGRIPCNRSGNKYLFDVDQVDEFLRKKALENIREERDEKILQYGKIRRIEA